MSIFPGGSLQHKIDFYQANRQLFSASDQQAMDYYLRSTTEGGLGADFEKRYSKIETGIESELNRIRKQLATEENNYANLTDTRSLDPGKAAEVMDSASTKERAARIQELRNQLGNFNQTYGTDYETTSKLVRDQKGNWIPKSESTVPGNAGRTGERVRIRQDVDGSYSIIGATTGQVFQSGIKDVSEANRVATGMQSGYVESADSVAARQAAGGAGGDTSSNSSSSSSSSITGSSSADQILTGIQGSVAKQEQAAASQGLTVTPEMRAMYVAQAQAEMAPYYSEVIRNAEFDLGTSLNRLVEDTRTREISLANQYKKNLQYQTQGLQDSGLLYGGVRQQKESDLATEANAGFQSLGTDLSRGIQDRSIAGERQLGSNELDAFGRQLGNTQDVGRVIAGSPIFQPGKDINVYQPQGGQYGDVNRDITYNTETRANQLEGAERDRFSTFT